MVLEPTAAVREIAALPRLPAGSSDDLCEEHRAQVQVPAFPIGNNPWRVRKWPLLVEAG